MSKWSIVTIFINFLCLISQFKQELLISKTYDFSSFQKNFNIDPTNSVLTLSKVDGKVNFATYLGKGVLSLIGNKYFEGKTFPTKMTMVIDTNENPEFLIFYIVFPAGYPPLIPQSIPFKYIFTKNSNPFYIFNLISSSGIDANGETVTPKFFQTVTEVNLPQGGIDLLNKRISNTISLLPSLGLTEADTIILQSAITTLSNFLKTSIQLTEDTTKILVTSFDESLPTFTEKLDPINLKPKEIIYVHSDEQTHIWVNDALDTIFIVDAGSQPLINGINAYIKQNTSIKNMNIFITHFHSDHMQSLAGLIKNSRNMNITLYLTRNHALQFAASLLQNYSHITGTINGKLTFYFQFKFLENFSENIVNGMNVKAEPILHNQFKENNFKHFILSATYAFFEPGACIKLFSGDINPVSGLDIATIRNQIKRYFEQVFLSVKSNINCVNYFWDYGHFTNNIDNYNTTLSAITAIDTVGNNLNVAYYYEHNKLQDGYKVYRISLEKQQTSNQVLFDPPNYIPTASGNYLTLGIFLFFSYFLIILT